MLAPLEITVNDLTRRYRAWCCWISKPKETGARWLGAVSRRASLPAFC